MIGRWLNRARMMVQSKPAHEAQTPETVSAAPRPQPHVVPRERPDPAFARQASVAGADGLLAQPSFARSPFTPTRPIQSEAALVGRRRQVERAISAIQLERANLAIFGERGHGKTSLANVVSALAEAAGYGVVRYSCSAGASFSDLIGSVLDRVPPRFLRRAAADPAEAKPVSGPLPAWTVAEVTAVLERIRAGHLLVFIDEFDRLTDDHAKRDMTELLKNCSDLALRVSFVLVGVAESLDELLALHRSIHRSLVAIPLPLLIDTDLIVLITQGCARLGLRLDPAPQAALLLLSHQSPYYAQLLSLHATDATLRRGDTTVTLADVAAAAQRVMDDTRAAFEPLLYRLPAGPAASALLYAAARAPSDGFGWFAATEVTLSGCADLEAALSALTRPETGPILRVRGAPGRAAFAFAQPNLRNYVLLRQVACRNPCADARSC